MKHVAVYPGSFDPMTRGHLDVIARSRRLFDEVVIGIGINFNKSALFTPEERLEMARELVAEQAAATPGDAPVRVERYSGLTVDFARSVEATVIVRGIRNVTDLSTECQLAITNRQVADIETVFVITGEQYAFTSSSLIRQVAALGGSLDRLEPIVPPQVLEALRRKAIEPDNPLARLARDQMID